MALHFTDDLDIVDQSTIEQTGPNYPVAQWQNGDPKLAAVGGIAHTGGIILPDKYLDESIAPAPGWTRTTVAFSSGKSETVLAAQKPRLAVIRTRFRWFVSANGVDTYYPRNAYEPDAGMRGHLQVLCGIHGFDDPIAITFKGKASQEFDRILRDFDQKIGQAAWKYARQKVKDAPRFPRFAFYLRLQPGPHVKVGPKGQESIVTPPVHDCPAVVGEDYLSKVYVGRDRLTELQRHYHAAAEWAAAWDKGQLEAEPRDEQLRDMAEELGAEYDDDPAMQPVGVPHQTAAQALGFDPGTGPVRRNNQYQAGR